MTQSSAIMFEFSDGRSAELACNMLRELSYDPVMHDENRLHIHVDSMDLTSALEIVQASGGQLTNETAITEEVLTGTAYSLNAITIPAHVVNEDWIDSETYGHFTGDVHI